MTSTTLLAPSGPLQYASIQEKGCPRCATHAPKAPLRTITWPVPLGPTPISRNRQQASSTSSFVVISGIDKSEKASSAFGLHRASQDH